MFSIAASIQQLTVISNMYNLHQGLLVKPSASWMLPHAGPILLWKYAWDELQSTNLENFKRMTREFHD